MKSCQWSSIRTLTLWISPAFKSLDIYVSTGNHNWQDSTRSVHNSLILFFFPILLIAVTAYEFCRNKNFFLEFLEKLLLEWFLESSEWPQLVPSFVSRRLSMRVMWMKLRLIQLTKDSLGPEQLAIQWSVRKAHSLPLTLSDSHLGFGTISLRIRSLFLS